MANSFATKQANVDFTNRLKYQTGMDFLDTPPDDLPGQGQYQWAVQVAVVASPEVWNRRSGTVWGDGFCDDMDVDPEPEHGQAAGSGVETKTNAEMSMERNSTSAKESHERNTVLLLRKAVPAGQEPWWEIPSGRILSTDLDVRSTVCRIVRSFCDLRVHEVVGVIGGTDRAVERSFDGKFRNDVMLLRFIVTVKEAPTLGSRDNAFVWMNEGHDRFHWLRSASEISDWKLPNHIRTSIEKALKFQPENFFPAMSCLKMSPRSLIRHNEYAWKITAAISRCDVSQPPAIMVLRRTKPWDSDHECDYWRLVEGQLDVTMESIEKAVAELVKTKTGFAMTKVVGATRELPRVKIERTSDSDIPGEAHLAFVVEVDEGLPRLANDCCESAWIEDLEDLGDQKSTIGFIPWDRFNIEQALNVARSDRRKLLEDGGW